MNLFSSSSLQTLEKALQGSALRQRTIAQNIANVDTPNYKAKRAEFQHTLGKEIEKSKSFQANRTHTDHLEFSTGSQREAYVKTVKSTMYNHNQNNVDIDHEMSELAKNQIYYNALIDRINGRFNSLQTVIKGGR
ncbi:flagellar basal body rod protein FlgB [Bacillus alkalicellulosilyticus]|uniref:flagellar basal body rod protein FlgB n=1 Tax=Alkalihalobacterium alkalicellulosilyticum TaxID=1912214 RepID=UPI000997A32E|nr:flagellar basal body rod protein FlgB [Bacillus alkalicellulosilyticus]